MVTRYAAPRHSLRRHISRRPAQWRERAFATTLRAATRREMAFGAAMRAERGADLT